MITIVPIAYAIQKISTTNTTDLRPGTYFANEGAYFPSNPGTSIPNIASIQQNERIWVQIERLYDEMIKPPVSLPEVSVFRGNASAARGESGEPLQKKIKP